MHPMKLTVPFLPGNTLSPGAVSIICAPVAVVTRSKLTVVHQEILEVSRKAWAANSRRNNFNRQKTVIKRSERLLALSLEVYITIASLLPQKVQKAATQ